MIHRANSISADGSIGIPASSRHSRAAATRNSSPPVAAGLLDVLGIDGPARKDGRAGREGERGVAPEDENLQVRAVANENHRRRVAHRHHEGSLRGAVTCPAWTSAAVSPASSSCSSTLDRRGPACGAGSNRAGDDRGGASGRDRRRRRSAHGRVHGRREWRAALLGPLINATGVLLHTNLGRAPLGADAVGEMAAASQYTNLEYRLTEGVRGSRHEHAGALARRSVRRRGRDRREQQRGRGVARARDVRARSVGRRLARRARRDRRRLSRPGDPRRDRRPSRRGRHDEPHPAHRLRRAHHARRSRCC